MLETTATAGMTVGFDIGGTNFRAAVVDPAGTILATVARPTARAAQQLEDDIAEVVAQFRAEYDVHAVGLAIAGFIDPSQEVVRFAPHLPWRDTPVRARMEKRLGVPVVIEHDANSAAWGEGQFGAGRGAQDWVFFAVGTGIGATLVTKDGIYRGAFGTAPEFGHLVVVPGGRPCPCGKRGCLERYASGTALPDIAQELRQSRPELADAASELGEQPTGVEITQAARGGNALGLAVMEEFSRWLGLGLSMVADVLDPELIVLGGGVAADGDLFLDGAARALDRDIVGAGHRPVARLATAELGSQAGMIGVADLAARAAR